MNGSRQQSSRRAITVLVRFESCWGVPGRAQPTGSVLRLTISSQASLIRNEEGGVIYQINNLKDFIREKRM